MTINQLPSAQKSLDRIAILIQLEKEADPNTVLGYTIINAIRKKVNGSDIIDFIKSQAQDNKDLVARVVGDDLLIKILTH